jgi:exodeoxyribonuclease VII large subunit
MAAEMPFDEEPGRLLAGERSGDNAGALSVSEISAALKRHVEAGFSHVRIRGEISGFKRPASGHLYFSLKDENARIDGVMWKGNATRLAFWPEDGLEVIATGKLTTYAGRSSYQIVVETMEIAGEGALLALLERLKAKLVGEGLFAAEKKRPLPFLPRTIGVVTSATGAVIRDILHRLEDRCPTRVIVWPVLVQGTGSAEQVAAAVRGFSEMAGPDRPDIVIVARGGGSIEDLWSFNEEIVVRAVAASTIPTISAVGHETDTTLCDFAADLRAPTPTAAAELAVPVRAELIAQIQSLGVRSLRCISRYAERADERLVSTARRLPTADTLLGSQRQRVDDQGDRLRRGLSYRLSDARGDLARLGGGLRTAILAQRLANARQRLNQTWRLAEMLHPKKPLERGYVLVTDRNGLIISDAASANKAKLLTVTFKDGAVPVRVEPNAGPAYVASKPEQPSLF